jgi:hypothetical protein
MDDKMLDRASSQAAQRAQQYWHIDGIAELVMGSFFVLMGLYFGAQAILPEDSFAGSMLTPAMLLVIVGGVIVSRSLIRKLKERLTYPRTGYVAYHTPAKKRRWLTAIVAFGMAMLVAALFASTPASMRWIPVISGLLIGAYWLYYGHKIGLVRFYVLAAISAVIGAAIAFAGMQERTGLPLYYTVMGLVLLVSGGLTLWSYLRQAPQPDGRGEAEK